MDNTARKRRLSFPPITASEISERVDHILNSLKPDGIEVRATSKGYSVFATQDFPAKFPICEYGGEFLSDHREIKSRTNYYKNTDPANTMQPSYVYEFDSYNAGRKLHQARDATYPDGSPGRYINHSLRPNIKGTVEWKRTENPTIIFYSLAPIKSGDELYFTYRVLPQNQQRVVMLFYHELQNNFNTLYESYKKSDRLNKVDFSWGNFTGDEKKEC